MWAPLIQGKQICLHSDNEATVFCINKKSSKKQGMHVPSLPSNINLHEISDIRDSTALPRKEKYLGRRALQGKNPTFPPIEQHSLNEPHTNPSPSYSLAHQLAAPATVDIVDNNHSFSNPVTSHKLPAAGHQPHTTATTQSCSKNNKNKIWHKRRNKQIYKHLRVPQQNQKMLLSLTE